jgi:DNA segregation ATPase FtsK/SpoIIIE, S-DNA-T family
MTSARRVGPTVAEASSRVATTLIDPAPAGAPAAKSSGPYVLPSLSLVQKSGNGGGFVAKKTDGAAKTAAELQSALNEFHVEAEVIDWVEGPTCTTYQVRPGEGVRVSKFTSLEDDIARTLARTSVRIYAPVPGTSYVGIEVSNNVRQNVAFGDVLPCVTGGPLDFAVGLDANGKPVHSDLAKLPHLLIAGTTGSGKSVTVNSIVLSFLMRDTPDDLRLIIVDPKQVEFSEYNGIPHLVMPVVTDPRQAAAALQWGVTEMDRRYRIFSNLGVRDLKAYNNLVANANFDESQTTLTHLPCIVVVIDELADLMMVAKKDVEASIVRIAQLGRAAGIHLIIATQTPRAEIVTGLIRANVANRIALRVSKGTDSRIIIDQGGAEKLLPHGDMLFLEAAYGDRPRRIQGCNVTDEEKSRILSHLKDQPASGKECSMAPLPGAGAQLQLDTSVDVDSERKSSTASPNDDDPLAWEAAKLVVENQLGSTSMIQRRMKLGYARAGRVMDLLEEMGVVGPARGSKPRDVLIADLDELETLRNADASTGE